MQHSSVVPSKCDTLEFTISLFDLLNIGPRQCPIPQHIRGRLLYNHVPEEIVQEIREAMCRGLSNSRGIVERSWPIREEHTSGISANDSLLTSIRMAMAYRMNSDVAHVTLYLQKDTNEAGSPQ